MTGGLAFVYDKNKTLHNNLNTSSVDDRTWSMNALSMFAIFMQLYLSYS
jgi:glutamate synthase domain-containing protein 3